MRKVGIGAAWNGLATVDHWAAIHSRAALTDAGSSDNTRASSAWNANRRATRNFCGEHTSVDAQGHLEVAVKTGERATAEVAGDPRV